jgi:Ca2+-binding RTX toxin-like protein
LPTFFAVSEQSRDWLFSIERLEWNPESDHIRLGKGVELLEEDLTLKLGMEGSDGKGDVLDFAEVDAGLLINASDDSALYVTAAVSEADAGLWAEEADWLVASAADDVIYGGAGLHGIEGGGGADLIDARDVTPGTGTSPEGYDLEIDGGQGDDTIVIGEGSTLLRGGAGSDTFVLSTLGGVARGDEIVFADADSSDRLLVPYDLFNGSGGDYEGSDLLPVLGAHGRYDDMVTEGWTLLFDWRLEEHWFWGDDQSQGVIDFFGTVSYEVADGDLLVHLIQSEAVPTVIPVDDAGNTRTMNLLEWIPGTETILRIEDYQEGDLGINFYDLGEGVSVDLGDGTGMHHPGHDPGVYAMTNNGQFIAPLEERPATPVRPDDSEAGAQPPPVITGGGGNDEIAAIEASHVEAGAGDDKVTGSPGADVLDGGTGADRLEGGAGRDSYVVDDHGDAVLEQGGGGIDSVAASVDFTLGANVEHLSLTGTAVLGRGNELANRLFGNDGANVLEGFAGDDTLYGGAGADAMHGGDGEDGYVYALGDGDDTLADSGGEGETDTLVLTGGIGPGDVAVHRLAATPDDVVLTFAQGGRVVLAGFMASPGAGIDAVAFDDGTVWSRAELQQKADAAPLLDNELPQAVDDPYLVAFGPEAVIQASALLANDRDFEGDPLTIVAVGEATVGSVILEADGSLRLIMPADFEGLTSFGYTVADSRGGLATAQAEVAIVANHAPAATAGIPDQSSPEDAAWSFTLPPGIFDDADGDRLVFGASLADGTALPAWLTFDAATATFSGTPPADFNGSVDLRITASDGAASASAGFRLLVTPTNDAPRAAADDGLVAHEGTPLVVAAAALLANDSDVDGDNLSLLTVASGPGGSVAIDAAGDVVFTPAPGAVGSASFTYTIGDGRGATATATASLTVEASAGATLIGTAADDVLAGTPAADVIEGGGGNDRLSGGGGDDTFKVLGGETGFDIVDGGAGLDRIAGSPWNDVIGIARLSGVEFIEAGTGSDTIRLTDGTIRSTSPASRSPALSSSMRARATIRSRARRRPTRSAAGRATTSLPAAMATTCSTSWVASRASTSSRAARGSTAFRRAHGTT